MNDFPITYLPGFFSNPDETLKALQDNLPWVRYDNAPRLECFMSTYEDPYTYGRGAGIRTYTPIPYLEPVTSIRAKVQGFCHTASELCFLNRYMDKKDQLGWHADDSPELSVFEPIMIATFGAEREIYFRENANRNNRLILTLEHGSLCIMHPGMQQTHEHRIPKAGYECGERISLTFRGRAPQ